jgi:hypothetical protein
MADNLQQAGLVSSSSSSGGVLSSLGLELFSNSRYYRPLLVGMSLMLFQQVGSSRQGAVRQAGRTGEKWACGIWHVHLACAFALGQSCTCWCQQMVSGVWHVAACTELLLGLCRTC